MSAPAHAQKSSEGGNSGIYTAIDIPVLDGRVHLAVDRTTDRHFEASQKLFMLLRLGSRPEILDDAAVTHLFRVFFSPAEMAPFVPKDDSRAKWSGEDEFQQEDSRKRFIAGYRARITRLIPSLPIDAMIETPVSTEDFKESLGGFDLRHRKGDDYGSNNLWGDPATASGLRGTYTEKLPDIHVAAPVRFPNLLRATEADARRIRELERSSTGRDGVIRAKVKFQMTKVRRLRQNEFVVDTIFSGIDLKTGVAFGSSVALSPPTFEARKVFTGAPARQPAYLNADLTRILAAKFAPRLLSDDAFVRESYFMRTLTERRMLIEGPNTVDASNWLPALPSGPVQFAGAHYGPSDIDGYRAWMKERVSDLGNVVRIRRIYAHNDRLSPAGAFNRWTLGSKAQLSEQTRNAIQQKYPATIGLAQVPSREDMNVVVAMNENEHWMAEKDGLGRDGNVFVDFEVKSGDVMMAEGKPLLLLVMNPIAYGLETADGSKTNRLDASKPVTGYQYDILGVKLGMDIDEAKDKLLSAFGDFQTAAKVNNFAEDPVMPQWVQIDVRRDGSVHERFLMGSLAGSRKLAFLKRSHGPGMPSTDGVKLSQLIDQKYGPAKKKDQITWIRSPNPATMSRMEQAKGCYSGVGFPYGYDNANYAFITERCGEVLAIQIVGGRAAYMLYDTTLITNARYEAARRPPPVDEVKGTASRL